MISAERGGNFPAAWRGCLSGVIDALGALIILAVGFAALAASAQAQLTRATLSGVVLDPSGARVQSVTVVLAQSLTGLRREVKTNAFGIYRFTAVEPGSYSVEFHAEGFKVRRISAIPIQSSSESILNQTLSLRDEYTSVEVVADPGASLWLGASGGGSSHWGMESIDGFPFLSALRDPQSLAVFIPLSARGPGFSGISSGGQRTRNQNFLLDGTDNNELSVTGSVLRMIPEQLAELKVQYPSHSTEFGQATGSQISLITRSGTNRLQASIWEYFRSNHLDSLGLTDKRAGFLAVPRFVNNQFGGSIGGPVQKDRTFFYVVLEASRRREAPSTRNAISITIPTSAGYAALASVPLGAGQPPGSRQRALQGLSFLPSVYSQLGPPSSPVVRSINSVPVEFQTLRVPVASPNDLWSGMLRLDHALNAAGNLSYRLLTDGRMQYNATGNLQFAERFAANNEILNQSHTASLSYALDLNWMSETRFAYLRSSLQFPENDPNSSTVQVLGAFTFGGFSTFPQGRQTNILQWQQVNSVGWGKHLVKFGADVRRNRMRNVSQFDLKGTWTFNNFTDFLNSQPSRLRHLLTDASYEASQTIQAYFVQDNIRLAQNWSFDLGARYELHGVPLGFFGTRDPALRAVGVPAQVRLDRNNLSPRAGFGYAPESRSPWGRTLFGAGETVIRVSYSMQYDVVYWNLLTVAAGNYPRAQKYDVLPPETAHLFPDLQPAPAALPPFDPLRFPFVNTPEDLQNPTSQQWRLELQRRFGPRQSLEFGYMGNRSYHLLRQSDRNPGILTPEQAESVILGRVIPSLQQRRLHPDWAARSVAESTAISKYHGAFLRHQQQVIPGLRSEVSLTWSGSFSDGDEPLAIADISSSTPQVPQDVFDYRRDWSRSVFDRPFRLSVVYMYDTESLARGWNSRSLAHHVFSGWKTGGALEWQSGQPFTVTTGVDSGGSGLAGAWRPDLVADGVLLPDPVEGNLRTFLASNLFATPRTAGGTPLANSMPSGGNLGRNTYRGPAFFLWNANISRNFGIAERFKLQVRGDFINLLRHRNFGNPVANMNSASFGDNTTDPGTRSVILGAKLLF